MDMLSGTPTSLPIYSRVTLMNKIELEIQNIIFGGSTQRNEYLSAVLIIHVLVSRERVPKAQ